MFLKICDAIGLGWCACILLAFYVFGVPGASRIPYLASIPVIGDLVAGRINTYAADQVAAAAAAMVSKAEAEAVHAQLAEKERLLSIADDALAEERERAAGLAKVAASRQSDLERRLEEAKRTPGLTYPSKEDMQWLQKHSQ